MLPMNEMVYRHAVEDAFRGQGFVVAVFFCIIGVINVPAAAKVRYGRHEPSV